MTQHTVLVVEDEPEIRELAVETLRDEGYQVLEAGTGDDAIRIIEQNPEIEVVFTDVMMSGIDGFRLADMAKSRRPAVKILYATGFPHCDYPGMIHGRVLQKPYRQNELARAISVALGTPST